VGKLIVFYIIRLFNSVTILFNKEILRLSQTLSYLGKEEDNLKNTKKGRI